MLLAMQRVPFSKTPWQSLRQRDKSTQQELAAALGLSVRAIASYDADSKLSGKTLAKLETYCQAKGYYDLELEFRSLLAEELGAWVSPEASSFFQYPKGESEGLWTTCILAILRQAEHAKLRATLIPLLKPVAEECIQRFEKMKAAARTRQEVIRLLDAGVPHAAIAKLVSVEEALITNFATGLRLKRLLEQAKKEN